MTIHEIYNTIKKHFCVTHLQRVAYQIANDESSCCYRDFLKSSRFCRQELARAGASRSEHIPLRADGRTAYLDFIMPEAWDIDEAWIDLLDPRGMPTERICDLNQSSFCVANRCASTGGKELIAELVPWEQAEHEPCLDGKLVLTSRAPGEIRRQLIQQRALGLISSYSEGALALPEGIAWCNGWTSGPGWYHTKEDKKLICFQVSPAKGVALQQLLEKQQGVKIALFVKSRTYSGTLYSVTGVLPGTTSKEILFLAHLFEPMLTDNAMGCAALIEICRLLHQCVQTGVLPPLKRGIRFLMSMERYGFAQFFHGANKRQNILTAINMDTIGADPALTGENVRLRHCPMSQPFMGDWILEYLAANYFSRRYPYQIEKGNFSDDTWIADQTIGIPTNWVWTPPGNYHHNSLDAKPVSWDLASELTLLIATYSYVLACDAPEISRFLCDLTRQTARQKIFDFHSRLFSRRDQLPALSRKEIKSQGQFFNAYLGRMMDTLAPFGLKHAEIAQSKHQLTALHRKYFAELSAQFSDTAVETQSPSTADYRADNIIIRRKSRGIPFSLAKVPFAKRKDIPVMPNILYSVLNWSDGKKTLRQLFREVEFEFENKLDDAMKKRILNLVLLLGQHGYLEVTYKQVITRADIKKCLGKLGIRAGDRIIVHSSLSRMGQVAGGAAAVCEALMELITPKGTLLMPGFNHGAAFEKGAPGYYAPAETPTTAGAIPDAFWRMKGVFRSLDPTHAVSAWGQHARDYVKNHHRVITMGAGSPLHLLEKQDGKVVLIDAPTANTFHHVVEMTNRVPCLGQRTEEYPVKLPSGKMVKCRTWGWREKSCPFIDGKTFYLAHMREQQLLREGNIGKAHVIVFKMSDCRQAVEDLLKGRIKGIPGCRTCQIRPRVHPATVSSDWDEAHQHVMPDTTASSDDYL